MFCRVNFMLLYQWSVNIVKNKIILASSSPRRKDILEKIGLDFEIIPSNYEEIFASPNFEYNAIETMAYNKALSVAKSINEDCLVIGADTVVVLDKMILGKPQSENEAINMLKALSGNTHFVVTSICIINTENFEQKISSVTSYVEFEQLSDDIIKNYVKAYKPMDKAGAYGIQELPKGFVKKIDGSLENVIGLCSEKLSEMLRDF